MHRIRVLDVLTEIIARPPWMLEARDAISGAPRWLCIRFIPHCGRRRSSRARSSKFLRSLVIGLALTAPSANLCAQAERVEPLEAYRQGAQQLIDQIVLPKLRNALSDADRLTLGAFRVEVIRSTDVLRVQLEPESRDSARFTVSAGFVSVLDVLFDASLVASAPAQHDALLQYAIDVSRFALRAGYEDDLASPAPLWKRLGWSEDDYRRLRNAAGYNEARSTAMIQMLAWLVANAITERLSEALRGPVDGEKPDHTSANERTAAHLIRARIVPVPPWPAAILHSAISLPDERDSRQWVCVVSKIYASGSAKAEAAGVGRGSDADAPRLREALNQWREIATTLERDGNCSAAHSPPKGSDE